MVVTTIGSSRLGSWMLKSSLKNLRSTLSNEGIG